MARQEIRVLFAVPIETHHFWQYSFQFVESISIYFVLEDHLCVIASFPYWSNSFYRKAFYLDLFDQAIVLIAEACN